MIESVPIPTPAPAASAHVDALPVGTRLGEFEILSLLGVGGFGMVYKAFDHSLHRAVAIKEFMPAALAMRGPDGALQTRSQADQPAFRAGLHSFVNEARLLAQFDHPSLVKVFRFWEDNHTAYMVMPLYSGLTFKQARAQMRTPPSEAWLRKVLWSVLGALRVLHNGQTLHRDVSPDNIFLQDLGPPVLLDLGAARHAINDRDRKHTAVLKVNYAPIEQYTDGDPELVPGPWSDLYSLAAVVHGCLCNDTPLPSTLRSIRDRMVPFARVAKTVKRQFGQEYSESFIEGITKALSLKPSDRPQSIDEFLQLLGMTTPPAGLELFDFRAELGDIWVEPTDQPGLGMATIPTVDLTAEVKDKIKPPIAAAATVPMDAAALTTTAAMSTAPGALDTEAFDAQETASFDAPDTVVLDAPDTVLMEDVVDSSLLDAMDTPHAAAPPGTRRYGLESEGGRSSRPAVAGHKTASRAIPKNGHAKSQRSTGVAWVVVGMAVLIVVGGIYGWRSQAGSKAASKNDDIITELAQPASAPASVAVAAAVPAVPAASEASAATPAASAASAADAPTEAASVPAPAFVPATDPRAASRAAAARRKAPAPAPAAPLPTPAPTPAPVEPTPAPPPPPPKPAPVVRLCEGESVFTRSMCLREQCRKPANAQLPVCVEFRRQMEPLENRQLAN